LSAVPSMTNRTKARWFVVAVLTGYLALTANTYAGQAQLTTPLLVSPGSERINFDDIGFSSDLHKVIVPAGRTGKLILIDPGSNKIEEIGGFSWQTGIGGDHGQGTTSASFGRGVIFAADRTEKTLDVVDPVSKKILTKTKLDSGPDYVRYVGATNEVWVTEPHASQIEIFTLAEHGIPEPTHAATIKILNGPESLAIDGDRGRAYTNLWTDTTLTVDLRKRTVVAQWRNGCRGSRGIALDPSRGFIFVGCEEGKLESLSLKDGGRLGEATAGAGVDIVAYSPTLHHAYLPGGASATMAVLDISRTGQPTVLTTVTTAKNSRCVTTDHLNNVYICDPEKRQF
jgi:DNA-binding beta-propeller fold protein YncE